VELPAEIDLSSIEFKDFYSQAMVDIPGKEPGTTITKKGKPIVYGITIPKNAPHPDLGVAFIKLLLSEEGQAIMNKNGQSSIVPAITNDLSKVPSELKPFVEEAKKVALAG
jgi:molybdate/tungstate transport system substrate-binding protein